MLESFLVYKYGYPSNRRAMLAAGFARPLAAGEKPAQTPFFRRRMAALPAPQAGVSRTCFVHAALF
ncbi:hypothetical protein ACFWP0_27480 [Achromobacter sp. NPDC058515]|uniref:hypothetical protein n=1 Tax=Achromobacter sp. NPDC058515 TaxID=3346533 RepID=UPI00366487E3